MRSPGPRETFAHSPPLVTLCWGCDEFALWAEMKCSGARRRCGVQTIPAVPEPPLDEETPPDAANSRAALRVGPVACASRGARIALKGRTAHASTPGKGVSPMAALAERSGFVEDEQ